jgi:hypothetical protein
MAALEQQVESRQVVHVPGTSSAVLLNAPAAFTCCLQELWCSTKESVEIFIGSPPFRVWYCWTAIDQPVRSAGAPDGLRCAGSPEATRFGRRLMVYRPDSVGYRFGTA